MRAVLTWDFDGAARPDTEPSVRVERSDVEPYIEVRDSWLAPEPAEPLWLPVLACDGRVIWRPELPRKAA